MTNQENVNWQFIFFCDKYKPLFKKKKTDVCFRPVTRFDREKFCDLMWSWLYLTPSDDALPQNSIVS